MKTPPVLAVDLAARYSALCWLAGDGRVQFQADSALLSTTDFIDLITHPFADPGQYTDAPAILMVEDLPHRLPFANLVKRVCRLQGRIGEAMDRVNQLDALRFVAPADWRKTYPGLERGTGPEAVLTVAAVHGYRPPKTIENILNTTTARKVATDYAAAYLIARWTQQMWQRHGSFTVPGTAGYNDIPKRTARAR